MLAFRVFNLAVVLYYYDITLIGIHIDFVIPMGGGGYHTSGFLFDLWLISINLSKVKKVFFETKNIITRKWYTVTKKLLILAHVSFNANKIETFIDFAYNLLIKIIQ